MPALPDPPLLELAPAGEARARRLSWRGLLGPVLLSLAALAVVLYVTWKPGTLEAMAATLRPGFLALALAALALQIAFGGLRLRYISNRAISLAGGLRGAIAWDFMSAITPSAFGGAPLAAYFVARDNRIPVGEATAIMLFSMLTDQLWFAVSIPLLLLATAFLDVFPLGGLGTGVLTAFFLGLMAWAGLFAYALLVRPAVLEAIARWVVRLPLLRRFEARVEAELVSLRARAELLRGQPPKFFLVGCLYAAGLWLARYAVALFVVLSVHPALDALTFYVRTAALMLTSMAVPTPGGSGGIEGLYVLFLAPLMPEALVGPTLLTWRLLSYHVFLAAGLAVTAHAVNRAARRAAPNHADEHR